MLPSARHLIHRVSASAFGSWGPQFKSQRGLKLAKIAFVWISRCYLIWNCNHMKLERVSLLNPFQGNPQGGCCEKAFMCQVFNPQKCHHTCATNCIVYEIVVYNCFFLQKVVGQNDTVMASCFLQLETTQLDKLHSFLFTLRVPMFTCVFQDQSFLICPLSLS